jgi:hypothetical protein
VEHFAASVALLGRRLGFPATVVEHLNPSPRDEAPTPDEARRYAADNPLEFELYALALERFRRACGEGS